MRSLRTKPRPGPLHVACIVETSMAFGREILWGVARYLSENDPWTVYIEQRSLTDRAPPWLRNWDGDGIISRLSPRETRLLRATGIPIVDLNDQGPGRCRPHIMSDHRAEGALAAAHLLERGFTSFAFFGYPQFRWAQDCQKGFAATLLSAGHSCQEYRGAQQVSWGHQQQSWEMEVEDVAKWIQSLPKPLGLMACNDFRGIQALDACRRAGLAIPEVVAVIGVDNEELVCTLANPRLSSVVPNARSIGYEAAALLDRLMRGEPEPTTPICLPPLEIVTRLSTDINAIADPDVAVAMRFIREHACAGIGVIDVLAQVPVSRAVLQRRFRSLLGRSIHEVIAEVRLQRVKQLLLESELPLSVIAKRSGFAHVEYLSAAFRRAFGIPPGAYRREHSKVL
ncbi:MAG: DNA-binding transcriptional regulator [Isosphaeraceae bacterium]|nr:DNA-binding transcriptional regulator [Isosphaeraceae bacterium]